MLTLLFFFFKFSETALFIAFLFLDRLIFLDISLKQKHLFDVFAIEPDILVIPALLVVQQVQPLVHWPQLLVVHRIRQLALRH